MRLTLRALAGVLAVGGVFAATSLAHAGGCCGGGGSYRSGSMYGRTPFAAGSGGGSGCNMAGMSMGGMPMSMSGMQGMSGMPMPAAAAPAPSALMQGMDMGGSAAPAPAAAGTTYFCPMHPNVVSNAPGACPVCHMALSRR